ncbi:YjzD family protein [Enterococcus nangangensis]|uniref:YjzD family protein n=1 Tax=Enterococcus nangangensis TaxID=2559926 RepID=UPI0010F78A0E|nr:YjzD family protein [Enterococcus nangangensis]
MRYIIVLFWAVLLGQIVGYLGGALNQQAYDPITTTVISLVAGVLVMIIGTVALPDKKKSTDQ